MEIQEFEKYFVKFLNIKPKQPPKHDAQKGERFIIFYLGYNNNKYLIAGDVSKEMNVSTARVAVLLNRLEKKGYIIKEQDEIDKRKTKVKLTKEGYNFYQMKMKRLMKYFEAIIDKIGYEGLDQFLEYLNIINRIGDEMNVETN